MENMISVALFIWDKVFKNGSSDICERQPLKNFTWSILKYFVPYVLYRLHTGYISNHYTGSSNKTQES